MIGFALERSSAPQELEKISHSRRRFSAANERDACVLKPFKWFHLHYRVI